MSFFSGSTVCSRTGSRGGEAWMGGAVDQKKRGAFELNIGWERSLEGWEAGKKQACVLSVHMNTE